MNRNNTFGTIFDGYIGASYSCTSEVFAGPGEASEPEIKNELWVVDMFDNIKFSNNIHSFGGYFMWAPGTYLPDRVVKGDAVHANIENEKYFFVAGDRILNRIKEHRNTVILPLERTGPIADVLTWRQQQRRRALVQPRHDRVQFRDRSRLLREHVAERRCYGRSDPVSGSRTGTGWRRRPISRSTRAR